MSLQAADTDFLCDVIARRSGNVITQRQDYLLEARLTPVAESAGLEDVAELVAELRRNPATPLYTTVTEAMTINETSFFRDVQPFVALQNHVLPELMEARKTVRALSFWSAACSSGQEAYSLAIQIRTFFPELDNWRVEILATDYSEMMVTRTQLGIFTQFEVNRGLSASLLRENFTRLGLNWQAVPQIRNIIRARQMNLVEEWPPSEPHDVILLRNVLIYFDQKTKLEILRRVYHVLKPDGFLILGGGETLLQPNELFRPVSFGKTVLFRPIHR